jgi:hypothetical protein
MVSALALSACGSSSKKSGGTSSNTSKAGKAGGSLTLGAEQWPDCINPINQ